MFDAALFKVELLLSNLGVRRIHRVRVHQALVLARDWLWFR